MSAPAVIFNYKVDDTELDIQFGDFELKTNNAAKQKTFADIVTTSNPKSQDPFGTLNAPKAKVDAVFSNVVAAYNATRDYPNDKLVRIKGNEILDIRFSQDTISSCTEDGIHIAKLSYLIRTKGFREDKALTLVEMPDVEITSLDNRRLQAAKFVVNNYSRSLEITAKVFHHTIKAPKDWEHAIRNKYFEFWRSYPGEFVRLPELPVLEDYTEEEQLRRGTYGDLVYTRMSSGEGDTYNFPYGFKNSPEVL